MSYRLFPDIIVASKIVDSYKRACDFLQDASVAINNIYISINGCLTHQRICKNMGIENIFTGSEDKENWDENDYRKFFNLFPRFFIKEDEFYRVNIKLMLNNFNKVDFTEGQLKEVVKERLLIQGAYPDRLLSALLL